MLLCLLATVGVAGWGAQPRSAALSAFGSLQSWTSIKNSPCLSWEEGRLENPRPESDLMTIVLFLCKDKENYNMCLEII
jgi:hypothetical protein